MVFYRRTTQSRKSTLSRPWRLLVPTSLCLVARTADFFLRQPLQATNVDDRFRLKSPVCKLFVEGGVVAESIEGGAGSIGLKLFDMVCNRSLSVGFVPPYYNSVNR